MQNRFGYRDKEEKPFDKDNESYSYEIEDHVETVQRDIEKTFTPLLDNLGVENSFIKGYVENVAWKYAATSCQEGLVHSELMSSDGKSKKNIEELKSTIEKTCKLSDTFYYLPYYLARIATVDESVSQTQLCMALGGISRPTLNKRMRRAMEIFDQEPSCEEYERLQELYRQGFYKLVPVNELQQEQDEEQQ